MLLKSIKKNKYYALKFDGFVFTFKSYSESKKITITMKWMKGMYSLVYIHNIRKHKKDILLSEAETE